MEAHLGTQPGPAEIATNCGSLCSYKHVSQGQTQAASGIGMHQSPCQEALEKHTQWEHQIISEQDLISYTSGTPKGRFQQEPDPAEANGLYVVSICTAAHTLWLGSILTFSQPEG